MTVVSHLDLSTRDSSAMLEAIRQVQARFIADTTPHEHFGDLLNALLSLTESEYGFIGEIISNNGVAPYLKTHAITDIAWNEETRALYNKFSGEGLKFHNLKTLFGHVIVTGKPVISDDPANDPRAGGLPPGHPTVRSFMGLPFFSSGKMIGMIGVANHPHGYALELVDWLRPFLNTCASLIVGNQNFRDRMQAEQSLQESEERYRTLVEDMPVLICRFLPDGTLTFVNKHYCLYFDRSFEQLVGHNLFEFIPTEDRERVKSHFTSLTQERPVITYKHKVVLADGRERWQRWTDRVVFRAQGRAAEYQSVGEDITDRIVRDEALQESEKRFRNLIEGSVQGIYIHRNLKPLFVNRSLANILGYESESTLLASMKTIDEHFAPHERERMLGYNKARFRGEEVPIQYEYEALRKDGGIVTLQNVVRVIHWEGEPATQCTVIDVSKARELSEQLSYQASHDALTDMLNRREFEQYLQQSLDTARAEKIEHVFCYLDLNQFKVINDTCGHVAGDELLRQISYLLRQHIRDRDTLARLGGDEFGILLEDCSVTEGTRVTNAVQKAVEEFRFQWEKKSFSIGISIGVVSINEASANMASVLSMADAACYVAKDTGYNRVHIYQPDDVELAKRQGEMQWVAVINRALEKNWFQLYFQPFISLASDGDKSEGFELLLRMHHEDGRIIEPGAFLPAAERYNLVTKLDRWVIGTAFDWFNRHREKLEGALIYSINLSGSSLGDDGVLEYVVEQLEEKRLPSEKICFEITETAAIYNLTNASKFIRALEELGCRFALDDFGSGLSSFAYLKGLPVDFLKIDGMFVKDIIDDPIDLAMVKSINDMGHAMGKQTIAEFVENDAILDKVKELGVDYAQGYGIARPRPLEDLITGSRAEVATGKK
jgi:diguanylate cyclase (GGDEF)-like protein/PAS domain S-box-containing protein